MNRYKKGNHQGQIRQADKNAKGGGDPLTSRQVQTRKGEKDKQKVYAKLGGKMEKVVSQSPTGGKRYEPQNGGWG